MTFSLLQQNSLRWYGHVLRKQDNSWMKKYMMYEVEGARLRGRDLERGYAKKDCQARKLNRKDAMNRSRWRKLIKDDL